MSDDATTPEAASFDPTEVMEQAIMPPEAAETAPESEVDEAVEENDTPETSEGEENKDEDTDNPDAEESEDTPEADEPDPETPEEEEEDKDKKPEKSKKDKKPKGSYTVGSREFSNPEDAITEANRISGRNGKLAGDLKTANEATDTAKSELDKAQKENEELKSANKAWDAWHKGGETGDAPIEKHDPDAIAKSVVKALGDKKTEDEAETSLQAQVDEIEALDNYDDVAEVIEKLSDKLNPLTDKTFTPKEAYSYAVKHTGLEDLLDKKPKAEKPEGDEKEEKKKPDKKAVKSAAARPSGSGQGAAPKKSERDSVDAMLDAEGYGG